MSGTVYRSILQQLYCSNTNNMVNATNILWYDYSNLFCIQISSTYYGIPGSVVEVFLSICDVCQKNKVQHNYTPMKNFFKTSGKNE